MWLLICFLGFFERLGDEYFSRWYVQHILLYGTLGIYIYIYSIFNLRLFLSILFYIFLILVLKRQTETANGTRIT